MTDVDQDLIWVDQIQRRVMFALELLDPLTGLPVVDGLRVSAEGLGPPQVTPSRRFVWRDIDPPAPRHIKLSVSSPWKIFAPLEFEIDVPKHETNIKAEDLLTRRTLQATGLLDPPPGMLAVGGMLADDDETTRKPVSAVAIRLQLRKQAGGIFATSYEAITDMRGGFVAAAPDLGSLALRAPPAPAPEGAVIGWLTFKSPQGDERYSGTLDGLRKDRLLRPASPFFWSKLSNAPP